MENEKFVNSNEIARLTIPPRNIQNRFDWSAYKVEALLECLTNIKLCHELKGWISIPILIRNLTGEKYDRSEFDPATTTEIEDDLST